MSIKPILFNTDMVRAILDGRKTVTRRILAEKVMLDKKWGLEREPYLHNGKWYYDEQTAVDDSRTIELKPKYQPGDILYVRETWCYGSETIDCLIKKAIEADKTYYRADKIISETVKWHPSIHMPKEAARIWLKVTNVRVERLQDITEEQAKAEGENALKYDDKTGEELSAALDWFPITWDNTVKKADIDRYGWDANPWVWVIEFGRCEKPEEVEQ